MYESDEALIEAIAKYNIEKTNNKGLVQRFTKVDDFCNALNKLKDVTNSQKEQKITSQIQSGFINASHEILLNILYAPRSSRLYSIGQTLTRLENLSHILAWSNVNDSKTLHRLWKKAARKWI